MDELEKIRNEINLVDERILEALANRRKLAQQIIRAKDQLGSPIRDALREEGLLTALIAKGRGQGLDAHLVTRVFHEIIDDSIRSQQLHLLDYGKSDLRRVAFQGIEGAYSEIAARKYFAPYLDHTLFVGAVTLEQVVDAIEDGDAEYGMLPVENTRRGASMRFTICCRAHSFPLWERKSFESSTAFWQWTKPRWPTSARFTLTRRLWRNA
jgi:chorismate mutase/prephenate dehydratase